MPLFITCDGIDTAGKSKLNEEMSQQFDFLSFKSPVCRSTKDIQAMNAQGVSDQQRYDFYISANLEDQEMFRKQLESGKSIILDRYFESTLAHQDDGSVDQHSLDRFDLPIDLKILLTVSEPEIRARLARRSNTTRFEDDIQHLCEVQERFLQRPFDLVIDTTSISVQEMVDQVGTVIRTLK